MSFGLLNTAILFGLAAIALPVIAHLLSRRRYDVVHWGAMQFLQLKRQTRRRIRIQDWLLLLLRISVLACLVLAFARPWGQGGPLAAMQPAIRQDVVFVLDSSASLDWKGGPQTPHDAAVQWIYDALEQLHPGDTVTLLEARNRPRRLVYPPTSDLPAVRAALEKLPAPRGSSHLPEAIADALKILAMTSNPLRRVVVLTDAQALPWDLEDAAAWERVNDLRRQFQPEPAIQVVALGPEGERSNVSVGPIQLSREVVVPGLPVTIRTTIRQSGGTPTRLPVHLEINGHRLEHKTATVHLLPASETSVQFEQAFPAAGSDVVSVVLDPDFLPSDDRNDSVVLVETGLPVLVVDGDPRRDVTKSETYFLRSAFSGGDGAAAWVNAQVIPAVELTPDRLSAVRVVMLCNVRSLTPSQADALDRFARDGGGLVIAPGDQIDPEAWNSPPSDKLLAARFVQMQEPAAADLVVTFESGSLVSPWLRRFRREEGIDLTQVRFSRWWELAPKGGIADDVSVPAAVVDARLSNGSPLIVSRPIGEGMVIQLAFPLDADWSTLPARNDFVPFLHELVFMLTSQAAHRNVQVGEPLRLNLPPGVAADGLRVTAPGAPPQGVETVRRGNESAILFRKTELPGVYRIEREQPAGGISEPFVVTDDRRESNLKGLSEADWRQLSQQGVQRTSELRAALASGTGPAPQVELWWLILGLVLLLLLSETALTRRMVQGGHLVDADETAAAEE